MLTLIKILLSQYALIDKDAYEYLNYMINSGKFNPNFVANQPFNVVDNEILYVLLEKFRSTGYPIPLMEEDYLGINISGKYGVVYRDNYDHSLALHGMFQYHHGPYSFVNQTGMNRNFLYDKYYHGELSESAHWIYGRVENAYFNYSGENIQIFLGRITRNWGPIGEKSLILSDNPYSYDQFEASYKSSKFKFSIFATQLNKIDTTYTYHYKDSTFSIELNAKRYLAGHRIDLEITRNFQIGLTEMTIFGGTNRNFDFAFLIPTAIYYDLQRNVNKSMNLLISLDLFYRNSKKWTLSSQLLIDDLIINNDPGVNDRRIYPDRLGILSNISKADAIFNGLNISITYARIWNHTYHSRDSWENYHINGVQLGYPYSALEELILKFGYWKLDRAWFTYYISYGRYGASNIDDVFTLEKDSFPLEPVESGWHSILNINYIIIKNLGVKIITETYSNLDVPYAKRFSQTSKFMLTIELSVMFDTKINI